MVLKSLEELGCPPSSLVINVLGYSQCIFYCWKSYDYLAPPFIIQTFFKFNFSYVPLIRVRLCFRNPTRYLPRCEFASTKNRFDNQIFRSHKIKSITSGHRWENYNDKNRLFPCSPNHYQFYYNSYLTINSVLYDKISNQRKKYAFVSTFR